MVRLKMHSVEGLGLSLDGSTADRHDSIRGGSRARAFEATGDPLGPDPFCTHQPKLSILR